MMNMKYNPILVGLLMACSAIAEAETTNDNDNAWTVGTDSNGKLIQQLEWIFKDELLTITNCPIRPGTILTVIKEENHRVKVKCDRDDVPNWQQWNQAILKGNIVVGWIDKSRLIRVPLKELIKYRRNAQPSAGRTTHPQWFRRPVNRDVGGPATARRLA